MPHSINIRPFQKNDSDKVIEFISEIIVNEFKFKLEFETLDSDIFAIDENYTSKILGRHRGSQEENPKVISIYNLT